MSAALFGGHYALVKAVKFMYKLIERVFIVVKLVESLSSEGSVAARKRFPLAAEQVSQKDFTLSVVANVQPLLLY